MMKRSMILAVLLILTMCSVVQAQADEEELYGLDVLPMLEDMPYGFYQDRAPDRNSSNREVANDFTDPIAIEEELDLQGRLGGFNVVYTNSLWPGLAEWNSTTTRGASNRWMTLDILNFETIEGAAIYFDSSVDRLRQRRNREIVERFSGPQIELADDTMHLFEVIDVSDEDETWYRWRTTTRVDRYVLITMVGATRGSADLEQLFDVTEMFTEKVFQDISN